MGDTVSVATTETADEVVGTLARYSAFPTATAKHLAPVAAHGIIDLRTYFLCKAASSSQLAFPELPVSIHASDILSPGNSDKLPSLAFKFSQIAAKRLGICVALTMRIGLATICGKG